MYYCNVLEKLALALSLIVPLSMMACSEKSDDGAGQQKSIVIVYENDVHCGIDGYTRLAGLRDAINEADTAYAAAVSVGDFLQGNTTGAISRGQYIIDIMRTIGYHAVTLGNHEFDYGVPRMRELLSRIEAPVVSANFYEAGATQPVYTPYVIHKYGNKRVAYVGAVTPETMILEGYSFYDTNGIKLYDLKADAFYDLVQQAVDAARAEGADYVVLLSHVGEQTQSMGFDSHQLVAKTRGIDVVLDGHTHSVIPGDVVANRDGQPIRVTQTGTQFANVGKLVISPTGVITTEVVPTADVPYESAVVSAATQSVKQRVDDATRRVVAHSDYPLAVNNADGSWIVRSAESNAGDIVADAYRWAMKSDVAFENGGGLRNSIPAGDITYGHIIGMLPYDNTLRRIVVNGKQIHDMLEACTKNVPHDDGAFPQCSGLRYTIHSQRHVVSDVEVLLADGSYAPLQLDKAYTVAVTDYNHTGGGFYGYLGQGTVVNESDLRYYEALAGYMTDVLGGRLGNAYAQPQGRITIIND